MLTVAQHSDHASYERCDCQMSSASLRVVKFPGVANNRETDLFLATSPVAVVVPH
jgi:hypothetical protein